MRFTYSEIRAVKIASKRECVRVGKLNATKHAKLAAQGK